MENRTLSAESRYKMGNGKRGKKQSAAHKRKISESLKGKTKSAEHRQKIAAARTGQLHSKATKRKISDTKRRKFAEIQRQRVQDKQISRAREMIGAGFSSHRVATFLDLTVTELMDMLYK